jgi:hypothetical protein
MDANSIQELLQGEGLCDFLDNSQLPDFGVSVEDSGPYRIPDDISDHESPPRRKRIRTGAGPSSQAQRAGAQATQQRDTDSETGETGATEYVPYGDDGFGLSLNDTEDENSTPRHIKQRLAFEQNWKNRAAWDLDTALASAHWVEQQRRDDIDERVRKLTEEHKKAVDRVQDRCKHCPCSQWATHSTETERVTLVAQDFVRVVQLPKMVCGGCSKPALFNPLYVQYFAATPVEQVWFLPPILSKMGFPGSAHTDALCIGITDYASGEYV